MNNFLSNPNFWTIIGGVAGLISLYYAYKSYGQKAKIKVLVFSRQKVLYDPTLHLIFTDNYSQNFQLGLSLYNTGNKNSQSVNIHLTFNSEVKISKTPDLGKFWHEHNQLPNFRSFQYKTDAKFYPPETNFTIGEFEISIPLINQVDSGFYFIANGVIEGDFKTACFLVLYDLNSDQMVIKHFQDKKINLGNNDWNLMIMNKKSNL
jgi:hypothetical protein